VKVAGQIGPAFNCPLAKGRPAVRAISLSLSRS
jgi:hypothetical protein